MAKDKQLQIPPCSVSIGGNFSIGENTADAKTQETFSSPSVDCFLKRNLRIEQIFPRKSLLYDFLLMDPERRKSIEEKEKKTKDAFKQLSSRAASFVLDTGWINREDMKKAIRDGRFETEFSKQAPYGARRGPKTKAELIDWANK